MLLKKWDFSLYFFHVFCCYCTETQLISLGFIVSRGSSQVPKCIHMGLKLTLSTLSGIPVTAVFLKRRYKQTFLNLNHKDLFSFGSGV